MTLPATIPREQIKILIVEDKRIISDDLSACITDLGYYVAGVCGNGADAIEALGRLKPDLVILDIYLKGDITGIEVAEAVNSRFHIPFIYLTAHSDKLTFNQAKLTHPHAYLLKPFEEKELQIALELALFNFSKERDLALTDQPSGTEKNFLMEGTVFIKEKERYIKVSLADIEYISAEGSYSVLHTSDRNVTFSINLSNLGERLNDKRFVRVHRSYIINAEMIESMDNSFLYIKKHQIPVSALYRKELTEKLRLI